MGGNLLEAIRCALVGFVCSGAGGQRRSQISGCISREIVGKKNKKKELFKRRTDFFLSSVHASGGCRSDGCGGGDGDSRSFRATDSLQGQDKDWTRTME